MNENLKICEKCKTVNENDATFCRNCGAKLETVETNAYNSQPEIQTVETSQPQETQPDFRNDAISEQEFYAYIGKNQNRFMPSFKKFFTGKKASFSPLVFLLTWLISPIAGSFWFFHRKINKLGSIFLSIGIVFTIISSALGVVFVNDIIDVAENYVNDYYYSQSYSSNSNTKLNPTANYDDEEFFKEFFGEDADDYYDDYYGDYDNSDDGIYDYDDDYALKNKFKEEIEALIPTLFKHIAILLIINILQLALAIVMGIYAKYWYFKDAAKKITAIKQQNPTPSSISQISLAGGTSCIIWVIALVAVVICYTIFSIAFTANITNELLNYINY